MTTVSSNTEVEYEGFGRHIDLTDAIRKILNDYPLGSPIIRELIQNSDDAGAISQVVVLDNRSFGTSSLLDSILARYQGPALLAFNNSTFTETDWKSLQSISNSEKKGDISKAGKYGLGFNAVHHITDVPSVLSDQFLVVLDPHEDLPKGGARVKLFQAQHLEDQLSAFKSLRHDTSSSPFNGTIIRLPLRTAEDASRSRIKKEETTVANIREIMASFIEYELETALLFLKHLKSIELREVLETGENIFLARVELLDIPGSRPWVKSDSSNTVQLNRLSVRVTSRDSPVITSDWLIRHEVGDLASVNIELTQRFPKKANMLEEEKLYPHVALALPISSQAISGRLFTYLRLPIETEFPVHIHALFALTSDRQGLRNSTETTQSGSREKILQLWNTYLFQNLITRAWANLLEDAKTHVENIYAFWPQRTLTSVDWKGLDTQILKHVLKNKLFVWPLHGADLGLFLTPQPRFARIGFDDTLVDTSETDEELLSALVKAGVLIIKPPPLIVQSLRNLGGTLISHKTLSPMTASQSLRKTTLNDSMGKLSSNEKVALLHYLYHPGAPNNLFDIPVVPRIDGSFVALKKSATHPIISQITSVYFASDAEIALFSSLESRFIHRSFIREATGPESATILNAPPEFIARTDAEQFGLEHGCHLTNDALLKPAGWLSEVHAWANSLVKGTSPNKFIDQLPLPLDDDSTCPTPNAPSPPIIESCTLPPVTIDMFHQLEIPLLHKDFKPTKYLRGLRRVSSPLDAEVLLRWLGTRSLQVTQMNVTLCAALHQHLSQSLQVGTQLSPRWGNVLCTLPVFVAYQPDGSGRPSRVYRPLTQSHQAVYVRAMEPSTNVLPLLPEHILFDFSQESNVKLIKALDPKAVSITELQLARLAADHMGSQPEHLIDEVFMKLIIQHIYSLYEEYRDTFNKLHNTPFVTTRAGRRAPFHLIDPRQTQLCDLFPSSHNEVFPTGLYAKTAVLNRLGAVSFFRMGISHNMIDECIENYTRNPVSQEIVRCAENFLELLDNLGVDVELPSSVGKKPWIPIEGQLFDASSCRDKSQTFLVSRVLPILSRTLRNRRLREVLGWSAGVPNPILRKQFLALVDETPSKDTINTLQKLLPEVVEKFTEAEYESLRTEIGDRGWLPIGGNLRPTHLVYISDGIRDLEPIFFKIPDKWQQFTGFFAKMGISDVPPHKYLIQELQNLAQSSDRPQDCLDRSIRLLDAICTSDLSQDLHAHVLIPDESGKLHPIVNIFFDDCRLHTDGGMRGSIKFAHPRISEDMATRLRLPKASERIIDTLAEDDGFYDFEQQETIQNKIRKTLLGYSAMSTCKEVLANAEDAGATSVSIIHDKRVFYETGSLCPSLHDIHRGPALIFHNNSVFTEKDWEGLTKVGEGGKTDRDSIGRFGLGALTFFHWTDVPLIISGDYAVFLDPSGKYLPSRPSTGGPRRGLKINLRQQCENDRIHGTIEPLVGVHGFDPQRFYDGTLIRLPQRYNSSKILDDTYKTPDIVTFLTQCEDDADMAFLFTKSLQRIAVERYECNGALSNVSCTARVHRQDPGFPISEHMDTCGDITSREVTVEKVSMGVKSEESFLVVKSAVCPNSLPPEPIRECARKHGLKTPSIGLACPVGTDNSTPKKQMHLMSTFAIGATQLPVHLHGEFILSSNRTSILMESVSSTSPETQYNEYLLGKLAPPAYLYLIHLLLLQSHPSALKLWPSCENPATEMLARETYNLISEFPGELFMTMKTAGHPARRIAACDAVFNREAGLTSFLRRMETPNIVQIARYGIPSDIPSLQFDNAEWVRGLVARSGDKLQQLFDHSSFDTLTRDLEHLITYIMSALGAQGLDGLHLLPTTALHAFRCGGDACEDFLVPSDTEKELFYFSKHRFLTHLGKDLSERLLVKNTGLNVRKMIPAMDVGPIMAQAFPVSQVIVHVTNMKTRIDNRWILRFHDYIVDNAVPLDILHSLPFIPLSHPRDSYISAESSNATFAVELPSMDSTLRAAIMQLGGFHAFSQWSDLPANLVPKPRSFNLALFSGWLAKHPNPNAWLMLDDATQKPLARTILSLLEIDDSVSLDQSSLLARLPIWNCSRSSGEEALKSAMDIVFLPFYSNSPEVYIRYLVRDRYFASEVGRRRKAAKLLGATVLTGPQDLIPFLSLPERLEADDISSFRDLLSIIANLDNIRHLAIAPNSHLELRSPHDLFNPEVYLFRVSLHPSQLLHEDFRPSGNTFNLSDLHTSLNFENVKICARAVDRAVSDPSVHNGGERAEAVYAALLWLTNVSPYQYQQLDNIAFIRRRADDLSPAWRRNYLPVLPQVVPPKKMVIQGHIPTAWTQRAGFSIEPPPALCNLWPTLGIPSISEVVKHLVTLASDVAGEVEDAYGHCNGFIHDLRGTYEHLQRQDPRAVHEALLGESDPRVFLNVENSQSRPWNWVSADGLVLDIDYDVPTQGLSYVRKFLAPYSDLLAAAGVRRIIPAKVEDLPVAKDGSETQSRKLLKGMQLLGDDFTDVTLVATDRNDPGEIRVHKVVLAATSSHFRALFGGEFREEETAELEISLQTLKAIIDYFYGRQPIQEHMVTAYDDDKIQTLLDLLVASDTYMLPELKMLAENTLLTGAAHFIRPTTAPHILGYSQKANCNRLENVCKDYIEKNAAFIAEYDSDASHNEV